MMPLLLVSVFLVMDDELSATKPSQRHAYLRKYIRNVVGANVTVGKHTLMNDDPSPSPGG
jgi:hypothetical protein